MDPVEPKGLSEEKMAKLERIGAACDCMCSSDQHAGAKGSGYNSDSCGCYCSQTGSSANNANKNSADNKGTKVVLSQIVSFLREYS